MLYESLILGVMLLCSVVVFLACVWRACMCVGVNGF